MVQNSAIVITGISITYFRNVTYFELEGYPSEELRYDLHRKTGIITFSLQAILVISLVLIFLRWDTHLFARLHSLAIPLPFELPLLLEMKNKS